MPKTRVKCEIFGTPSELCGNVLPTYCDVMRLYLSYREIFKDESNKDPSVLDICKKVIIDVKSIWQKASLPVISDQRIIQKLKDYNEKYKVIKKNKSVSKIKTFKNNSLKLFDISSCKCATFNSCNCKIKVPIIERQYLQDQRGERRMMIGKVDVKTTKKIEKSLERKEIEKRRFEMKIKDMNSEYLTVQSANNENEDDCDDQTDDKSDTKCTEPNIILEASTSSRMPYKKGLDLSNVAEACDRSGISDRNASLLVNAVLKDFNLVSDEDPSLIIDRSKMRRERKRRRKNLANEEMEQQKEVTGIYFDGRKDKSLAIEKIGSSYHSKQITEEHIVLVAEPGATYLGHVTPTSGSASGIKTSIFNFLTNYLGDNLNKIAAVGCDGTVVNTGYKNGVIKQLELSLKRPVHWFICLLHCNELPLRHLIHQIDGKTNDPRGFTGPIGKQLSNCDKMSVVPFQIIKPDVELPSIDVCDLSTDQKYLYEMVQAIGEGTVSSQLAAKQPGKISHARWLTTANRILRLYVSTEGPSNELNILTEYVIKVYATTWFLVKHKSPCKYGPKHLFHLIQASRYLPTKFKDTVNKVIQRNAFFAHPENVLLAMLADDRKYIRELALRRVLKSRVSRNDNQIRDFKVPKLNFAATDYTELIDWQSEEVTEPPLTKSISEAVLRNMIVNIPETIEILSFPCHTQAVERHIKMVTEASTSVCGNTARDGVIRAKIASRKATPKMETKKDFITQ